MNTLKYKWMCNLGMYLLKKFVYTYILHLFINIIYKVNDSFHFPVLIKGSLSGELVSPQAFDSSDRHGVQELRGSSESHR